MFPPLALMSSSTAACSLAVVNMEPKSLCCLEPTMHGTRPGFRPLTNACIAWISEMPEQLFFIAVHLDMKSTYDSLSYWTQRFSLLILLGRLYVPRKCWANTLAMSSHLSTVLDGNPLIQSRAPSNNIKGRNLTASKLAALLIWTAV